MILKINNGASGVIPCTNCGTCAAPNINADNTILTNIKLLLDVSLKIFFRTIKIPEIHNKHKTIDTNEVYEDLSLITIVHSNAMELDVSNLSANDAATQILAHVKNILSKITKT